MAPTYALLLTLPAVLALLWYSGGLFYGEEGRIARGVVIRFLLTIAGPIVCLLGVPLVVVALFFDLATGIWQAMIAGLFISTGWLTTSVFAEQGKSRLKAERTRDYHKALYAEIGTSVDALWDEGNSEEYVVTILDRMAQDVDFVPFIPREHHDYIYDAIVKEIDVLPRQTIDAVVAYYSQIKAIAALAEDMRGDRFQELGQARRVLMYQDYAGMRKQAFAYGQHALRLIKAFSQGGVAAADAVTEQVNNPGGAPNDQSQGSA